jgi:hypothetical protein
MLHNRRFSISPIVFVFIAFTLALMFSCSEQPTAIDKEPGGDLSGSGAIDPGASGSFLLGEVSDSSIAPGTIEVWAMNVAFNETTGMATFDVQLLNGTERAIAPPIRFVIANIRPADIAVVDFDGVSRDGFPFYDFSAKLGGDGVLEPGERTDRVTMKFHTVTPRSFAIGFRIDIGPPDGTGTIGGVVFLDSNGNGERDRACRCEAGIPGITVALERTLSGGDRVTLLTRTDENGEYRFTGNREGVHKVFVGAPEDVWKVTSSNPLLVTLIKGADGKVQDFLGANFGLFPLRPETTLFGPIETGIFAPLGTMEIDSAFVNPPSLLPVLFKYYLFVNGCPAGMPSTLDSAEAWINGEIVFKYVRTMTDTLCFAPRTIEIRDGLVKEGRNTIRLHMDADEWALLEWRVYKRP